MATCRKCISASAKTTAASMYKPSSLEALKDSIERYLKEKQFTVSPRSREFDMGKQRSECKETRFKKEGLGRLKAVCVSIKKKKKTRNWRDRNRRIKFFAYVEGMNNVNWNLGMWCNWLMHLERHIKNIITAILNGMELAGLITGKRFQESTARTVW